MALVIRLKRTGAKKRMCSRIVVAEKTFKRDGRNVEEIGSYNPRTNPPQVTIDKERAEHWLKVGAKPSLTVKSLLKKQGIR